MLSKRENTRRAQDIKNSNLATQPLLEPVSQLNGEKRVDAQGAERLSDVERIDISHQKAK